MNIQPLTTLELRREEIPRCATIAALEERMGCDLSHEHRHYLENRPVNCGDFLELHESGKWVVGRYEWTGDPEDRAVLYVGKRIVGLDDGCLLRWPPA